VMEHREALAQWLQGNGIDPKAVALDWLSIERAGDKQLIRYLTHRVNEDGRRLVDPRHPNEAWKDERVTPLLVNLDIPAGGDCHAK
ncbi:hypothetical protein ACFQ6C_34765, partial [Streptomyces sp. NPDC056454]